VLPLFAGIWKRGAGLGPAIAFLIFATWGKPEESLGVWHAVYSVKWLLTGIFAAGLGFLFVIWFRVKALKVVLAGVVVMATVSGMFFGAYFA
jgi:hypothetical protein